MCDTVSLSVLKAEFSKRGESILFECISFSNQSKNAFDMFSWNRDALTWPGL